MKKEKSELLYATFVYGGLIGGCIYILEKSIQGWIEIISGF